MEFLWEVVMKCSDSILCQKSGEISKDIITKYEARSQVALEDALKKVENVDVLGRGYAPTSRYLKVKIETLRASVRPSVHLSVRPSVCTVTLFLIQKGERT